jgi:transcriptional regulator with XRE-family HTH domain
MSKTRTRKVELGAIVRQMRKDKRMSQSQFAKTVNVSKSTISLYENGKRRPDPQAVNTFMRLFELADTTQKAQLREWLSQN